MITCRECNGCILLDPGEGHAAQLEELIRPCTYRKGELIFKQGAPIGRCHLLCRGRVKLVREMLGTKKKIVAIITPGDMIDKTVLFDTMEDHSIYAEALEDSQVCFISIHDCLAWLQRYPVIVVKVLRIFSKEISNLWQELADMAYKDVRKRMVTLLLALTEGRKGEDKIPTGFNGVEIAEMLGVSRETVVRHLMQLKERGLITVEDRQVVVLDRGRLQHL